MIKSNSIKATGMVKVELRDANNSIKQSFTVKNLVVDSGLDYIAELLGFTGPDQMSHMALGTDNTAAAAGDTQLITQLGARVALVSTTVVDNTVEFVADFAAGANTGAIVEAGIFNASTAATMLCRTVFDVVNKGALDSMTITWTITIS